MSNQRWVTLATNDSYGLGALVLAHSLRRVGSAYPAVVLITPSVTEAMRERLRAVFSEVVIVDVLDSRDAAHLALLQRPELGITFTKIHCWNLTQYEKCVFLDADTLVIQNCDELFEREELSAAPDVGWPDCFNSGVFVFRPSADTFSNLITFAAERGSFDGGDQGLLNSYFSDWAQGDNKKRLPFLYNVTSAAFYSYLPALKHFGQNLKIIHFIGAIKPWLQQYNWESRSVEAPEHLRNFLQIWWDLFVADVHAQLDTTMDFTVHDRKYLAIPFIKSSKSIHSHKSLRSHEYNMCSKHTPQDSNIEEEDNIEEESSAVLQQEIADFREPVLHNAYYEPILDPNSEFQWHHPDNQIPDSEINVPEIDMSQFYDPWNIYRGNIPPSTEKSVSTEQTIDDYQDMRKYAWDYMPPQQKQYETISSNNREKNSLDNYPHVHTYNEPFQTYTTCNYSEHTQYFEHTQQQTNFPSFNSESHNIQQHSEHYYDHSQQHFQDNSHHDTQTHNVKNYNQQQMPVSINQEPHNSHKHHYSHIDRSQDDNNFSKEQHHESQINHHISNIHKNEQEISGQHKKGRNFTSHLQLQNQNKAEHVYTVMMDHARMRCQQISDVTVNGYDSDTDSDLYEELRPRHPYDGFYLRHRMTIDSHGRKICTHEIPLTPRSPTSDSTEEFEDAFETFLDDINDKPLIDDKIQTGVAGNLARVVPGAPLQREAVDELTRRQGWEAGNIDYMGADSFDNIWAKISQTLSQPPATQPEQSLEQQSESVPQHPGDPVAVEANMEVVEAVAEKQSVLPTPEKEDLAPSVEKNETEVTTSAESEVSKSTESEVPKPAESEVLKSTETEVSKLSESEVSKSAETEVPKSAEIEVSKLAESEVPKSSETEVSKSAESEVPKSAESKAAEPAASVTEEVPTSTPQEPEPAEVPVPASEASEPSSKVEEPIPIPAEIAAEIPATVDVVVPVESSSPANLIEKSEQAEIPVAALEALKIDEPLTETSLPVTVVEQPTVPEPAAELVSEPVPEPVSEPVLEPVPDPVPITPAVAEPVPVAVASAEPAAASVEPASPPEAPVAKPEISSDSPPLANTPSKEEIPVAPAAKSEERRKPAGKLQLRPPAAADALPTPDSELEDAAALAHAIIASELRTPTVTAPSPPALAAAPAAPAPAPAAPLSRLSVQEPEVPSPPVGSVSLTQIGVKPKPSTAARIESSVSAKTEIAPKSSEVTDAPKKKVVKKVLKKDKEGASGVDAPVPPPRKKEKKPKEK